MAKAKVGAVPIVDKNRIVKGILTKRALVRAFIMRKAEETKSNKLSAHSAVFEKPIFAVKTDALMNLMRKISVSGADQVIIQDADGQYIGLVNSIDVLTEFL